MTIPVVPMCCVENLIFLWVHGGNLYIYLVYGSVVSLMFLLLGKSGVFIMFTLRVRTNREHPHLVGTHMV